MRRSWELPSEQEMREMAKLSVLSGKLTEVQLKNLKMFPLVFFNGVTSALLDYNLEVGQPEVDYKIYKNKKNEPDIRYEMKKEKPRSFVSYRLSLEENASNDHLEKRFAALEKAVRDIFWKEVKVKVFINSNLAYESTDVR